MMANLLTLPEARKALGWADGTHPDEDADLTELFIPLVTEAVEAICGRLADREERWRTARPAPVTTPWAAGSVTEVRVDGTPIDGWTWAAPMLTIDDPTYTPGAEVTVIAIDLPVPSMIKAAARATLKSVWNSLRQGSGSDGRPQPEAPNDPSMLLPPLAWRLLGPYRAAGEIYGGRR